METPPTVISPVPGTARSGTPLSPEEAQPGTVPRPPPRYPQASQLAPGSTDEEDAPSLRRTPPTPTPTNTHLWKYRPARWVPRSAGTLRYAPAEPSGSWTRRGNPGGIWSEMRPAPYANPIDQIDPITQDGSRFTISQPGGLRRPDRRRPGGGAAPLRGDRRRRQGAGNRNRRGPARVKSAATGPWANQEDLLKDVSAADISRLLGVSRTTVYRYLGPGWPLRPGHDLTDQPARLRPGALKPVGGPVLAILRRRIEGSLGNILSPAPTRGSR